MKLNGFFKNNFKKYNDYIMESLYDVKQINAKNVNDETWKHLISLDPTLNIENPLDDEQLKKSPEGMMRWILKRYNTFTSTSPENIKNVFKQFNQLKNKKGLLKSNDINQYKSFDELASAVNEVLPKMSINQQNKQAKKNAKEISSEKVLGLYMNGAVELLFNGDEWEVWTPHTFEGSKALRKGAVWCTGGDTPTHYDSYTNEGTLYVIIRKADATEKYQLFVSDDPQIASHGREFRDKDNESMRFRDLCNEYPELLDFFMTQENVLKSYPNLDDPDEDDEFDEDREYEIMDEYHLLYNDMGELCIGYNIHWMTENCKYITDDNVYDILKYGYMESSLDGYDVREYYENTIKNKYFVKDISWSDTELNDLYEKYEEDSKNPVSFETFLFTLFQTEDEEHNKEVEDWLTEHYDDENEGWKDEIYDKITKYPFDDLIAGNVIDSLRGYGFDPQEAARNPDDGMFLTNYGDFMVKLDDCHSVEEFYRRYTHNGEKPFSDVVDEVTGGEIDLSDCEPSYCDDYYSYEGNDVHQEDASEIYKLFQ